MIATITLFAVYAIIHGWSNAVLYSLKGYNAFKGDEHIGLTIERAIVWLIPLVVTVFSLPAIQVIVCMICGAFIFPFFHNNSYYHFRSKIDGSYRGWYDFTKGSSSAINFKLWQRTSLLIIGILIYILYVNI